jgi:hypothetical protein
MGLMITFVDRFPLDLKDIYGSEFVFPHCIIFPYRTSLCNTSMFDRQTGLREAIGNFNLECYWEAA